VARRLGWTLFVPVAGLVSTSDKNTGYERTAIGNQLRPFNSSSPRDSTSAPDCPCAVVVCADAAGCGSRVGLGAGTTSQTRTGLYAPDAWARCDRHGRFGLFNSAPVA